MVIVEKALGVLLVKPGCEIQLRNTWYVDIENDAGANKEKEVNRVR